MNACDVWTSHYRLRDPDRIDITRAGCDRLLRAGEFAPGVVLALSVRIMNSRMRGALGFGNWIACPLFAREEASVYACAQDCTDIVIRGTMADHPDPKPIDAMRWILGRLPKGSILDPTCGSGTTLVAAREAGRAAIGIEADERHCETAAMRLGATPKDVSAFGPLFGGEQKERS